MDGTFDEGPLWGRDEDDRGLDDENNWTFDDSPL